MSWPVAAILVLAGIIHACWNMIAKKSIDKQVFLWLALIVSFVAALAAAFMTGEPFPSNQSLRLVFLSGSIEAVYFTLLGSAYQSGDLSAVYPVARGSAPVFATAIARVSLDESLPLTGLAGIALVCAGLYSTSVGAANRARWSGGSFTLAVLTGLTTAAYSVVDRAGMQQSSPLPYISLVFGVSALLLLPRMVTSKRAAVVREWRKNAGGIVAVGLLSGVAYILALVAMRSTGAGYVTAVREVSVVFAALFGAIVLREPFGLARIGSSLIIFAGIVCIALAR